MASSVRGPRSSNGMPRMSNSSFSQPTPTPRRTLPLDSASSVATSFASVTGFRCGRIRIPVPSRTVVVRAATQASHTSGSGIGTSSGPGIRPLFEYGYSDP